MKYAVLKTKEGVGEWMLSTTVGGKDYRLEFKEENGFKVKVPIPLTFPDPFEKGKTIVARENYPLELLTAYPKLLELVDEGEVGLSEEVQAEQKKQKKGKKDEKVS